VLDVDEDQWNDWGPRSWRLWRTWKPLHRETRAPSVAALVEMIRSKDVASRETDRAVLPSLRRLEGEIARPEQR
jgi:hypothetical protein